MKQDRLALATRRYEAVALALAGYGLGQIATKIGVSNERVRGMLIQQAGHDFYPQLMIERDKRKGKTFDGHRYTETADGKLHRVWGE